MTLGAGDLVLCSGTLPRATRRSAIGSTPTVAGGFAGMSLWGRDYASARARRSRPTPTSGRVLDDNGIASPSSTPRGGGCPAPPRSRRGSPRSSTPRRCSRYGEAELFRIADVVGARSLNAVDVFGGDWTVDDAAEAFAGLCDRARRARPARAPRVPAVVAHPRSSAPRWEIVRARRSTERWHRRRRVALLPQRCRRARAAHGARRSGARAPARRRPAAAGGEPAPRDAARAAAPRRTASSISWGCSARCDAIGAVAPVGVEVFSDELHALGPVDAARQAGDATRALLARAR